VSDPWQYQRESYFPCNDEKDLYADLFTDYKSLFTCGQSKENAAVDIAIVGDSHAAHLFFGLARSLPDRNIAYYTLSGTSPFEDSAKMNRMLDYVALDSNVETVIISSAWAEHDVSELNLVKTLEKLRETVPKVFITDDIPVFPFPAAQCMYGISPLLPISRCAQPLDDFNALHSAYFPRLQQGVDQVPGTELLRTAQYFCDEAKCNMTRDGILLYYDFGHLNQQGSVYLAERLLNNEPNFKKFLETGK
jgi:hypothetical protein